jgi:alkylation response protein AidB-like acyl-CoA dehydrogenase
VTASVVGGQVVDRARALRDVVGQQAAESERLRTMSAPIVDALWSSGLMTAFNPSEAGGLEPDFAEMIETWLEMAWQDGSFGWIGIANFPSAFAAACYLPDAGFAEVFTANGNNVTMGGQFAPLGQGIEVDDGYRLTGSWSFGSGTGHAQYVAAGFMPLRDGQPLMMDNGMPVMKVALLPRDEVTFTDGWHVQGLKGTGSYDYTVADVFVPEYRTFDLFARDPLRGGSPAARMGLMAVTAAGHAAWALGVAKSMLDDVRELAATKFRMSDMASLASRPTFQKDLAHHVCAWRAARLLLLDVFGEAEDAVRADGLTPGHRADLRAAAVYATDVARECAQWAHLAAGTTSIREGSRLERAFRDLYTGTQHAFISEKVAMDAAQVWLGLVEDNFAL